MALPVGGDVTTREQCALVGGKWQWYFFLMEVQYEHA